MADLRKNLQAIGSDLIVRQGLPETVLPQLAQDLEASAVFASKEVTSEETRAERAVEEKLHAQVSN